MTPPLMALIKWVIELCRAELEACHCAKEFTLWLIRSVGHQEKLAFECLLLTDTRRDPSAGKNFVLIFL
jgi:hypothetical protein